MSTFTWTAHRRRSASAAAALVIASALLAGCGGDSGDSGTTPTPGPKSSRFEGLAPLVDCLRKNGVDVPDRITRAQVLETYNSLSKEQRRQVRTACQSVAPSGIARLLDPSPS